MSWPAEWTCYAHTVVHCDFALCTTLRGERFAGPDVPAPDDVQLRCLLLCKGDCDCGMRCKDAPRPQRTSVGIPVTDSSMVPPSLVEAASTPEPVSLVDIDSPEVPRPLGTGDDWFVIPVRRTLTCSSSLPVRATDALRDGSFVVTDALFKRIVTFSEMQPTLEAFASITSA